MDHLLFTSLLGDLVTYGEKEELKRKAQKAHHVYVKCLLCRKTLIAGKIEAKYGRYWRFFQDDATIAFAYALNTKKDQRR